MIPETFAAAVELRDAADGPVVGVTLIQEGRAATGGRAEVFAPRALQWPAEGVPLRLAHGQPGALQIVPSRDAEMRIAAEAPATPAVAEAIRAGKSGASVEFYALDEVRTPAGVREIRSAYLVGAALTDHPEYDQGRAELRARRFFL